MNAARCPRCDQPIPADAFVGDVAQCPSCDQVVSAMAQASGSAPVEAPPYGVSVRPHEAGVALVLPWRRDVGLDWHVVVLGTSFVFAGLGAALAAMATPGIAVACAVAVLLLSGIWLRTMINRTVVVVAANGIDIRHGPLPSLQASATVPMAHLENLLVGRTTSKTVKTQRGSRPRRWHYHALTTPVGPRDLLEQWRRPDSLAYVRQVIIEAAANPPGEP